MNVPGVPSEISNDHTFQQIKEPKGQVNGRNVHSNATTPSVSSTHLKIIHQATNTITSNHNEVETEYDKKVIRAVLLPEDRTLLTHEAIVKKLRKFHANGVVPEKHIYSRHHVNPFEPITETKVIPTEHKMLEYVIGFNMNGKKYLVANDDKHKEELEKNNPDSQILIAPKELLPQLNQILQESVNKYFAYRLSLVNETKEKEKSEKNTHLAPPSPSTSHYASSSDYQPVTKKAATQKLLNLSQDFLLHEILLAAIISKREEEKDEQATTEKEDRIASEELKREIRKDEIKKEEIKKQEKQQFVSESQ